LEDITGKLTKFEFRLSYTDFPTILSKESSGGLRVPSKLSLLSNVSSLDRLFYKGSAHFPSAVETVQQIPVKHKKSKSPAGEDVKLLIETPISQDVFNLNGIEEDTVKSIEVSDDNESHRIHINSIVTRISSESALKTVPNRDIEASKIAALKGKSISFDHKAAYEFNRNINETIALPSEKTEGPDQHANECENSTGSTEEIEPLGLPVSTIYQKMSSLMEDSPTICDHSRNVSNVGLYLEHSGNAIVTESQIKIDKTSETDQIEPSDDTLPASRSSSLPDIDGVTIPNCNLKMGNSRSFPAAVIHGSTTLIGSAASFIHETISSLPTHIPFMRQGHKSQVIEDDSFEFICKENGVEHSLVKFKHPIEWRICPVRGLSFQKFKCIQCSRIIGISTFN
jgi:hypothetical protein